MLRTFTFQENPYIGVFMRASDNLALVPPVVREEDRAMVGEVLKVPVITSTIGNANIIGSLMACNSNGWVASNIITSPEFQHLARYMNLTILRERNNALGNVILASDTRALISPFLSKQSERIIGDILDVEVLRGTIAGQDNVGMSAVITGKGLLCHPKITDEEKTVLDDFFGMRSSIGTVNFGIPLIGAGLCANSHGALVGGKTTGVELNRIEHALDLI